MHFVVFGIDKAHVGGPKVLRGGGDGETKNGIGGRGMKWKYHKNLLKSIIKGQVLAARVVARECQPGVVPDGTEPQVGGEGIAHHAELVDVLDGGFHLDRHRPCRTHTPEGENTIANVR